MRKPVQAAGVLACTLLLLSFLLFVHPFLRLSDGLDALYGVPPKWTQVEDVYKNPNTQEVTHGDDPVPSLKVLSNYWGARPEATRILFVGNSQMHTVSLAEGEARPMGPEKTYVDLIADRLVQHSTNTLTYRLSSSGMSYPEVLWDLMYMMNRPDLKPDAIVMQLNYQAFWTGGIRDSILALLDDAEFHARIVDAAQANKPYSAAFQDALHRYNGRKNSHNAVSGSGNGPTSTFSASATPGYAIETVTREGLDYDPGFRKRALAKDDMVNFLYRCRLYFLRLKPSTARSVTGGRLVAAHAAVIDIVQLCHAEKVQLFLFSAPVNPLVSLYRTPEDHAGYRDFIQQVAVENGGPLYDFEDAIGASHWGNLLNGPDPLHMGREAHVQMAHEMYEKIPLGQVAIRAGGRR
jgi:hypothetical protein